MWTFLKPGQIEGSPKMFLFCAGGNLIKLSGQTSWTPQTCQAHTLGWVCCLNTFLGEDKSASLSESQDSLDFVHSCCRTAHSRTSGTFCVQLLLLVMSRVKSSRLFGFVLTRSGWSFAYVSTAFSSRNYIWLLEMTVKLGPDHYQAENITY